MNQVSEKITAELFCLRLAGANTSAIYWGKYNVSREMYPPLHRYPQVNR